jgi:hypothetical protein
MRNIKNLPDREEKTQWAQNFPSFAVSGFAISLIRANLLATILSAFADGFRLFAAAQYDRNFPVDIIPPWSSMHINHLGDEH